MSIFNSVSGYISSRTRSRRRYCASSHETAVTWALDTDLNMIPVVRHQPLPLHTTGTLLLSHYLCLYRRNDGMACPVSSVLVDSLTMSDGRCVSLVHVYFPVCYVHLHLQDNYLCLVVVGVTLHKWGIFIG